MHFGWRQRSSLKRVAALTGVKQYPCRQIRGVLFGNKPPIRHKSRRSLPTKLFIEFPSYSSCFAFRHPTSPFGHRSFTKIYTTYNDEINKLDDIIIPNFKIMWFTIMLQAFLMAMLATTCAGAGLGAYAGVAVGSAFAYLVATAMPEPRGDINNTPYTILNVTVSSSKSDIKAAYDKKMKLLNPISKMSRWFQKEDDNKDLIQATERAYETITDDLLRCKYHRGTLIPDWYGVPKLCWGEMAINWLEKYKAGLQAQGAHSYGQQTQNIIGAWSFAPTDKKIKEAKKEAEKEANSGPASSKQPVEAAESTPTTAESPVSAPAETKSAPAAAKITNPKVERTSTKIKFAARPASVKTKSAAKEKSALIKAKSTAATVKPVSAKTKPSAKVKPVTTPVISPVPAVKSTLTKAFNFLVDLLTKTIPHFFSSTLPRLSRTVYTKTTTSLSGLSQSITHFLNSKTTTSLSGLSQSITHSLNSTLLQPARLATTALKTKTLLSLQTITHFFRSTLPQTFTSTLSPLTSLLSSAVTHLLTHRHSILHAPLNFLFPISIFLYLLLFTSHIPDFLASLSPHTLGRILLAMQLTLLSLLLVLLSIILYIVSQSKAGAEISSFIAENTPDAVKGWYRAAKTRAVTAVYSHLLFLLTFVPLLALYSALRGPLRNPFVAFVIARTLLSGLDGGSREFLSHPLVRIPVVVAASVLAGVVYVLRSGWVLDGAGGVEFEWAEWRLPYLLKWPLWYLRFGLRSGGGLVKRESSVEQRVVRRVVQGVLVAGIWWGVLWLVG